MHFHGGFPLVVAICGGIAASLALYAIFGGDVTALVWRFWGRVLDDKTPARRSDSDNLSADEVAARLSTAKQVSAR